jgi:pyruvate/2-oxoglutarate dehydrogenase complex dihydrolipoamide dehydrogenase (E3) component
LRSERGETAGFLKILVDADSQQFLGAALLGVEGDEAVHAIAMAHDDIWATVGTHPHEAKENPQLTAQTLQALAARPKVVGIG